MAYNLPQVLALIILNKISCVLVHSLELFIFSLYCLLFCRPDWRGPQNSFLSLFSFNQAIVLKKEVLTQVNHFLFF